LGFLAGVVAADFAILVPRRERGKIERGEDEK
jgi:hypothetical protein